MTPAIKIGRLANGMQIVVIPDRRAPIVTHMVWYRNGSADDPVGRSGVAHFVEHLMFKGTERYPAGHFTQILAAEGGQENAFTSWNYTCYYQQVLRDQLAVCMAYEADRMHNLAFDEALIASERDVVLEERAMNFDSRPETLLAEMMISAAVPTHPAGRPIIGWRPEIAGLTGRDARAYYRRFYQPNNAILVVAGDVDLTQVMAQAEKSYGALPPGEPVPDRLREQDPPLRTLRLITLRDERVRQQQLQRLHIVPAPRMAVPGEAEALAVLAVLLGGDRTSLLQNRLVVEQKLATSVTSSYLDTYFTDQARFMMKAVPADGVSPQALDDALDAELHAVWIHGFEAGAIERAKTQLVADALYALDNQFRRAQGYGQALSLGLGVEAVATWPARIEAVTSGAIQRALALLNSAGGVSGYLLGAAA
ncbi:pitrilysin family protein [Methylobacterium sp. 1030]|uniref:M16 family metallopeptidase n=1 Tax=Methylobacterium sp. 1030 TaxID=3156404 RepID=UPI0033926E86